MKAQHSRFNFLWFNLWLILLPNISWAQIITIVDNEGNALPGVEVYTDDFSIGVISDDQGTVTLENVLDETRINFRFLGYEGFSSTLKDLAPQFIVTLTPSDELIEEVIVLGRKEVLQKEIPYSIKSISYRDIQSTHAQTSADALSQHGGVYVQKSQMGGGSPVIRGFEANRVLLVVDGIRLNNAIYRNGHLQNAITVDQAMLDKMDIIFGPNSLIYGSDALGGVVNFKTRDPILAKDQNTVVQSNIYSRYATANSERSGHFDISIGHRNFGSLTSLTYSKFGDLSSGNNRDDRFPDFGKRLVYQSTDSNNNDLELSNDDPNVQIGTAYDQFDLLQKFVFLPDANQRISANIQFSTSSDVPRYDNLSEVRNGTLRWGEWYYGPQNRLLAALDYRNFLSNKFFDEAVLIGAYQKIDEDRNFRRFNNAIRMSQREDVSVYSLTADFSKYLSESERIEFEYGVDIQYNNVGSTAYEEDISTGGITPNAISRYASGHNQLTNLGAYIYLRGKTANEYFNYNAGLRWASSSYELSYNLEDPIDWPDQFYTGITGSNSSLTWSIGGTMAGASGIQLRAILSTAFRSPNIDDFSKIRVNGEEITFPNLDLKPEKSFNAEMTIAFQKNKLKNISLTGFYTHLTDAIIRAPFINLQGQSEWITQGDTLNIVANQNIQRGRIYGISFNLAGALTNSLQYEGSFNYTRGTELGPGENQPLAHIPPTYGNVGLKYGHGRWQLRFAYRFNAFKDIADYGGSADNPELATPLGALSWSTINLYSNYKVSESFSVSLAAENILDKHYRPFASGVSAPGRNLIISVSGKF